jgi:SpoVK/Ycf46/Vps4 family AAA+-type ATPase
MVDLIRAEVLDIADPQGVGRVKISAAALGAAWEAWAPVLRPDPLSPPPKFEPGDVVLIALEGGALDSPVVLGALSSRARLSASSLPDADHDRSDLVVAAETREALDDVAAWVRHEKALLGDWGLGRHFAPGSRALFHGAPGTGKTMAAMVLAKDLAMPIHRVDLAAVVGNYIGETEKNLSALFDAAEAGGAILLFDEADALFGKRSDVKDSHDRYANIEINYLLQRLERFSGLAILTSNSKDLMEAACTRGITVVRFRMPDAQERLQLWRRALGALPADRVEPFDPAAIADKHALSGGQIMSVLRAACLAAVERAAKVGEGDIRAAIARLKP